MVTMTINGTEELVQRVQLARSLPDPKMRRAIREAAGATQLEVAKAVGVCRATIAHYERGAKTPRGEHLVRYVDVLRALREVP